MNKEQRKTIGAKIIELGNLAIAALLFGQFISGRPINIWLSALGTAIAFGCYIIGFFLLKGVEE